MNMIKPHIRKVKNRKLWECYQQGVAYAIGPSPETAYLYWTAWKDRPHLNRIVYGRESLGHIAK